jgi:hypothetical protein
MPTVTLVYGAIARNRAPADLQAALLALPLDTALSDLAGLSLVSDTGAAVGNVVTRTIVYQTGAPPQLIPDDHIGETCTGWYAVEFSKALATPITAAPPVVS